LFAESASARVDEWRNRCKREGDAELHDVEEASEVEDVESWLRQPHEDELFVGPHPMLAHERFWPDMPDVFLAYGVPSAGSVTPGSY
jgi:hypothetical protein